MKKMPHWIRRLKHRLLDGYDCCVIHDLDVYASQWLLPKLKSFREVCYSHPAELTEKQWDKYLGEMIYALDCHINERDGGEDREVDWKRVDRGTKLLGKYWRNLWL